MTCTSNQTEAISTHYAVPLMRGHGENTDTISLRGGKPSTQRLNGLRTPSQPGLRALETPTHLGAAEAICSAATRCNINTQLDIGPVLLMA